LFGSGEDDEPGIEPLVIGKAGLATGELGLD